MAQAVETLAWVVVDGSQPELVKELRAMFLEYESALGIDLCFQGFAQELRSLPEPYFAAFLVRDHAGPVACGAVKDLGDGVCEVKRVYVRSAYRGHGLGREMTERLIQVGRERGFTTVRLDTLARLKPALDLYKSMGFREVEAYNFNPHPDIVYLERAI